MVRFGPRDVDFPSADLAELRDANELLESGRALSDRMDEDGYLLLRGLLDRETVAKARTTILQYMQEHEALEPGKPVLEGVMANGRTVGMMGKKDITHHPDVLAVLESPKLFSFYEKLLGEPTLSYDFKWLRGVGNEEYSGAHMDVVYMGRGSIERLFTCWVPFGDIEVEQGTLAMCVGSHRSEGFERIRSTYGRMDVDRDGVEGWFSRDPMELAERFGGQWATTSYRMGDVITFGMYTMHASTTNLTNRFRLSCDVRFQPESEDVDPRWVGERPVAHGTYGQQPLKPIAVAREEWGL